MVLELGMPATVFTGSREEGDGMAAVMIGIDPHKASHTAVAISAAEELLGELRVRASAVQAQRLLAWAAAWPERAWAIEGAGGLGHLLAQQLLAAGERVLDVAPRLGARVRLLATGDTNKTTLTTLARWLSRRCARRAAARWRLMITRRC
jgi:transposase